MVRLTFILLLITSISNAQMESDYLIYSRTIDSRINKFDKDRVMISKVIVIKKYLPEENWAEGFIDQLINPDSYTIDRIFKNDSGLVNLFTKKYVKDGLADLVKNFYQTPDLNATKFNLKLPLETISQHKYKRYMKSIFGWRIEKGWKKFYNHYPTAFGVYEFSKVIYCGDYAIFYQGFHGGPLNGSGDLVIMKKMAPGWKILKYLNIWVS